MTFTIAQIAALIGGEVQGDNSLTVNQLAKIEEGVVGSISFLSNAKYEAFLYTTKASAVIVNQDFEPKKAFSTTLIRVKDSYAAFTVLLEEYSKILNYSKSGIEQPSFIGENTSYGSGIYLGTFATIGKNCTIGENVKIHPQVTVGDNVKIGDNTILYPGVRIYYDTQIGANCTIHANAVIGSDGFGFAPLPDGSYKAIPQLGNVIIEDDVSIGANTTVDRATLGSTIIRQGVKLDNLVMVAHNVEIGKNTVMAACSGIAGSTKIGENCKIGGAVGIIGHLTIANNTSINAVSGVFKSVKKENTSIWGFPAFDQAEFIRSSVVYKRLPELEKRLSELEKNK